MSTRSSCSQGFIRTRASRSGKSWMRRRERRGGVACDALRGEPSVRQWVQVESGGKDRKAGQGPPVASSQLPPRILGKLVLLVYLDQV